MVCLILFVILKYQWSIDYLFSNPCLFYFDPPNYSTNYYSNKDIVVMKLI